MNALSRAQPDPPLMDVYQALLDRFGPQHWWPGRTRFEVMVGAVLTQNTSWSNVEKAIRNLKREKALRPEAIHRAPPARLAEWIRPSGYFNVKARRLQALAGMLMDRYRGRLDRLFRTPTPDLREQLLEVPGVGPETADSILLYAGRRPVFVVYAYTRRFMIRHGWAERGVTYDQLAARFTERLPQDVPLYNEFHALVVALGKHYCRPRPVCEGCPLRRHLPPAGPRPL
jgi:endonuclease-3 related protein